MGIEDASHEFRYFVQPEVKLPRKNKNGEFEWSSSDAVHPLWVIKRQTAETEPWNVELVEHEVTTVVACEFTGQVGKTAPFTDTVKVTVPCVVNSKAIAAGEVVILKMAVSPKCKVKGKQSGKTWAESVQEAERKRLKG